MHQGMFLLALIAALTGACGGGEPMGQESRSAEPSVTVAARSEVTLPAVDVVGVQSMGLVLSPFGPQGTQLAVGQIFTPPSDHPILFAADFLYQNRGPSSSTVNLKLRLSPWQSDRPGQVIVESEVVSVPPDNMGWIEFDLTPTKLDPKQRYIAWLTMVGLPNPERSTFSIMTMGPHRAADKPGAWEYDYPAGMRATWKVEGFASELEHMTATPWTTEKPGHNLHFRMIFENRAP